MKHLVVSLLSLVILSNCANLPSASNEPGVMVFAVTGLLSADPSVETQPTIMEIDFTADNLEASFTQTIEFKEGRWIAYSPELSADTYNAAVYRLYNGETLVDTVTDIDYSVKVKGGEAVLFPESVILFRDREAKGDFKPFGFGLNRWQRLLESELQATTWRLTIPKSVE